MQDPHRLCATSRRGGRGPVASRLRVPPAWPPRWPEGVDVTMEESQSDTSEGEQDDVDADVDGSDGSDGGDGGDEAAREDPCVD